MGRFLSGETTNTALDHVSRHDAGGWWAAVLSAIAIVVSGLSLWETVLKQADLSVYVGDTISYTLDPFGNQEVVAVPITFTNGGAQDSAVMKVTLAIKNLTTNESDRFDGLYIADTRYFGEVDDVSTGKRRTKLPFAPLAVAGHAAYTGTILFYPTKVRMGSRDPLLAKDTKIDVVLTTTTPPTAGWLDGLIGGSAPPSIRMTLSVPPYNPGTLLSGDMVRLKQTP
jgi:hypothetical protein